MIEKIIPLAFFVVLLDSGLVQAQTSGEKENIFPYGYQEKILDNGFKMIAIPMESGGLASYYSIVRTGSRDEYEPGHTGFAHFFEHMMFRGTKNFPGDVYDRMVTEMGADANAYTSKDLTCYHLNFASEDLETVMKLESDRFLNLSYTESDFKTEAGAVHGEYLKSLSSPYFAMHEKLVNTAFDRHTYKHTVIGFKKDIEAMPGMYDYSLSFFNRYYRPENVILVVAGDIKPDKIFRLGQKYYGSWNAGYVPPQIPQEPPQIGERKAEVKFTGKSLPMLTIAFRGLAFDPASTEMAACILMGDVMFGETSALYKKLVLDEQKVQDIDCDFSSSRDPELMTIETIIKKEGDIRFVEKEIEKTIKTFQKNRVEEYVLQDAKSRRKYGFLMRLNTPGRVSGSLAGIIAMTGGIEAVNTVYAGFDRVTPEDIQNAARKFLVNETKTVIELKGR